MNKNIQIVHVSATTKDEPDIEVTEKPARRRFTAEYKIHILLKSCR